MWCSTGMAVCTQPTYHWDLQVLEALPKFPSDGLDVTRLDSEAISQCVQQLTTHVLNLARLSVDGDHRLLLNSLICFSIQRDQKNVFSDEELSLLTHGQDSKSQHFISRVSHTLLQTQLHCHYRQPRPGPTAQPGRLWVER